MKLFTIPNCGSCTILKLQLKAANIEVECVDVSTEPGLKQARRLVVGGLFGVPTLLCRGVRYGPNAKEIMEVILEEGKANEKLRINDKWFDSAMDTISIEFCSASLELVQCMTEENSPNSRLILGSTAASTKEELIHWANEGSTLDV